MSLRELERLDAKILEAERRAARNLAAHLREAVRDIPSESKLGLMFVQHAKRFEAWADSWSPGIWTNGTLNDLHQELWGLRCQGDDA